MNSISGLLKSLKILLLFWVLNTEAVAWPLSFQPKARHGATKPLPDKGTLKRYQSRHFIVESPVALQKTQLGLFVQTIESVPEVMKQLPLSLFTPPRNGRATVRLVNEESSFIQAGGSKGAAGFYNGRSRQVILRGEYFLSEAGRARPNYDLLIHELTHLCMHENLWKYQPWFHEGIAEYLAAAHSHEGNFRFNQIATKIKDHVRGRVNRPTGSVTVRSLVELVELSSKDWSLEVSKKSPEEALRLYNSALLLVHYQLHGGPRRRQETEDYLKAIGTVNYTKDFRPRLVTFKSAQSIESRLKRYWSPKGLQLIFR